MINKIVLVDNITVIANNTIHVRTATILEEDGVELSKTYHRHTLSPGDDLTNQDPRVISIANAIWSEENL